jgi:hypothetical protein
VNALDRDRCDRTARPPRGSREIAELAAHEP